jgi:hypothetical protein
VVSSSGAGERLQSEHAGSSLFNAVGTWAKRHRDVILAFAQRCAAGGVWGAEFGGAATGGPGAGPGALAFCLFGGGAAVVGDYDSANVFPDWPKK